MKQPAEILRTVNFGSLKIDLIGRDVGRPPSTEEKERVHCCE